MITTQDVINWSDLKTILTDDKHLMLIVPAVNHYVESLPSIDRLENGDWAETTQMGAVMLAARWYRRKNSPGGLEAAGDGGVTYIARHDSDISRLLNLDSFVKPVIG